MGVSSLSRFPLSVYLHLGMSLSEFPLSVFPTNKNPIFLKDILCKNSLHFLGPRLQTTNFMTNKFSRHSQFFPSLASALQLVPFQHI